MSVEESQKTYPHRMCGTCLLQGDGDAHVLNAHTISEHGYCVFCGKPASENEPHPKCKNPIQNQRAEA